MKTSNTTLTGGTNVTILTGILALAAIILGSAAIRTGQASKMEVEQLRATMDAQVSRVMQAETQLRSLTSNINTTLGSARLDIANLHDQIAKLAAPPAAKKAAAEPAPAAGPATTHTIRSGDTLGELAKKYGTSVEAIQKLNPGADSRHLNIGQKIRVR